MESPILYPSASASSSSSHSSSAGMERQDTLQPRPKHAPSPTAVFRTSLPLPPLIPPLRFTLLAAGEASRTAQLFSSSHPLPRHLPFLSRLKLKTLLALTPKHPTKQVPAIEKWAQKEAVEIKWIKIEAWKDAGASAITKDVAEEAISTIISSSASPLLIVSLTPGPTALVLALLRLLQGYPLDSIHPETHRCLRAGLEGEADEDDKQDCEKWITGWIGKEINLAVHRSQVHEWTWPQGTTLRWLRITDGRNSKHANVASPSAGKDGGFYFPPSAAAGNGTTSSLDSPFTPHRSTTFGPAHSPALLVSSPQVTHPFLKVKFLPEPVIPLTLDPPALQSSATPPLFASAVPLVKPSGPAEGLSTPATALKMPVGFKGRKRSLTISEGRGGGPAAAAVAAMMEAAAAAAINATSLDIDGSSGIAGHVPAGVHSGSAPPTAAPFAEAQPPPWLKSDYGPISTASHWRWGNETSQRQHRECFPGEYEEAQQALHTPMTRTSSGDEEDEEDEENSTPKANTRTQYLLNDPELPAIGTTPSRAPDQPSYSLPAQRSPEDLILAPRRLSEAALMAEGEGESTPTKARSVSRSRPSVGRRASRGEASGPILLPASDDEAGRAPLDQHTRQLSPAKRGHVEAEEEDEEEEDDEEDEDEDDYHEDSEDDFSEGLEALDLA